MLDVPNPPLVLMAALVSLAAVRRVTREPKEAGSSYTNRRLGLGFGVFAAAIWGLALAEPLDSMPMGFQVGLGLFFLLAGVEPLIKPKRAGILRSLTNLGLSFLLISPVFPTVVERLHPQNAPQTVEPLRQVQELRGTLEDLDLLTLEADVTRSQMAQSIAGFQFESFDQLAEHPEGRVLLESVARMELERNELLAQREALMVQVARLETNLQTEDHDALHAASSKGKGLDIELADLKRVWEALHNDE